MAEQSAGQGSKATSTLRRRGDKPADGKERGGSASSYGFECNICLSTAQRPVVTVCGHLYCWPCIYKWTQHSKKGECPVCKAGVTINNVIPIYGPGGQKDDPRKDKVPERPKGLRPRAKSAQDAGQSRHQASAFSRAAGGRPDRFSVFPSLFSNIREPSAPLFIPNQQGSGAAVDQAVLRNPVQNAQQEKWSRMCLVFGSFVILCLLLL